MARPCTTNNHHARELIACPQAVVHVVNTVLLPSSKTLDMYKPMAPSSR